jgi:hypothetical protein
MRWNMITPDMLVYESLATIRFVGENLDPSEITRLIGAEPHIWNVKGEAAWVGGKQGPNRLPPRYGSWSRVAKVRAPADPDAQIAELFDPLPDAADLWNELALRYEGVVSVTLFLRPGGQAVGLSSETLSAVAARRLSLEFDIYPMDPADIRSASNL